jgi:hypothetical protein
VKKNFSFIRLFSFIENKPHGAKREIKKIKKEYRIKRIFKKRNKSSLRQTRKESSSRSTMNTIFEKRKVIN